MRYGYSTAYTQNPKPNWAEAPPLHKTVQDAKDLKSYKAAKLQTKNKTKIHLFWVEELSFDWPCFRD